MSDDTTPRPLPNAARPAGPEPPNRRDFLRRAATAGLTLAGAGVLAWGLADAKGPGPDEGRQASFTPPSYALAPAAPALAIVHSRDRVAAARAGLEALGGLARFISPGDQVVVKVNAAFASPPALGATTQPDLVAEVVRLCLAAGAAQVVVTDNPINDPQSCFELSGIGPAATRAGARVMLPRPEMFRPATLPGGRLIKNWPFLWRPLAGAQKLIGLAPVKDHHRSGASLSMKNWYGLLGGQRAVFHQDIGNIIKELALLISPTLVILDGVTSMISNGPTGGSPSDLAPTHTLVVSTDQVAADAVGAELLGRRPADLPFLPLAAAAGAGTLDYRSLSPRMVDLG
ncbi:MAG: DUF362 domain-containing protein [Deltaproteobacteria bacterium]|nr:DUF362 domain-containing protein [Deltaproteobacteria bacterium]